MSWIMATVTNASLAAQIACELERLASPSLHFPGNLTTSKSP
jgi:hypothetical protein